LEQKLGSALLHNLIAGAGSSSQFVGGLVVAVLYAVIGLLGAIGSILVFRRIFHGRWEQIFWASFLVVIAAFYLSFAAYFGASPHAWQTELIGFGVFLVCALCGLFSRSAIAIGYILHGLWDLSHCLSGSSFAGVSITDIPLGYGIFCSAFDFVVAAYLMISDTAWHKPGRFDPYFWRHIARADEVIE
jgi:hypothetical protein